MNVITGLVISTELRDRSQSLAGRLAPAQVLPSPRWHEFVRDLRLDSSNEKLSSRHTIVVGPPAAVLRHARSAVKNQEFGNQEFGFITPVAQIVRPWERGAAWRDETTLDLWRLGWSPQVVDRVLVARKQPGSRGSVRVEFLVGLARRTPSLAP